MISKMWNINIFRNSQPAVKSVNSPISAPRKRAFDRLDVSPFDFEALSKRYVDDDYLFDARRKKAFDRLDDSGFFNGFNRKRRAFDRLEDSGFFGFNRNRRAFDRLEDSGFFFNKRDGE